MGTRIFKPALQPFETRLMRYALAGSALLAAPAAHASIIYSGPLDTLVSAGGSLPVSLDGGPADFTISVTDTDGDTITVTPDSTDGGGTSRTLLLLGPVAYGTQLNSLNVKDDGTGNATKLLYIKGANTSGPWLNFSSPGYLGVGFKAGTQEYLGWAELQLEQATPSATLLGYAYNDVAGAPINTGDTGASAAPEPSSLSLFALGAAGVLALRRRRKKA